MSLIPFGGSDFRGFALDHTKELIKHVFVLSYQSASVHQALEV